MSATVWRLKLAEHVPPPLNQRGKAKLHGAGKAPVLEAGPGLAVLRHGGEDSLSFTGLGDKSSTAGDRHLALHEAFWSSPGPPGVKVKHQELVITEGPSSGSGHLRAGGIEHIT